MSTPRPYSPASQGPVTIAGDVTASIEPPRVTVIASRRKRWSLDLGEVWRHRDLLFYLAWRDIKVRYKQTALGVAWVVLQPVTAAVVFSLFFGRLARIPTDGVPYPLFAFTGTVLWQFFSRALTDSSVSLAANERLLSKVYFPRLLLPLGVIVAAGVDLAISFVLAVIVVFFYGRVPPWTIVIVPVVVLMVMTAALGMGLIFSSMDVRYRDVRYVLPFLVQVWMFASPIVYPASLVPAKWRALFALNPMVGFVETFRAAVIGQAPVPWKLLGTSSVVALVLLVAGVFMLNSVDREITDLV